MNADAVIPRLDVSIVVRVNAREVVLNRSYLANATVPVQPMADLVTREMAKAVMPALYADVTRELLGLQNPLQG